MWRLVLWGVVILAAFGCLAALIPPLASAGAAAKYGAVHRVLQERGEALQIYMEVNDYRFPLDMSEYKKDTERVLVEVVGGLEGSKIDDEVELKEVWILKGVHVNDDRFQAWLDGEFAIRRGNAEDVEALRRVED